MAVLVAGVVLLTYKKPEEKSAPASAHVPLSSRGHRSATKGTFERDEEEALHERDGDGEEDATVWQLGDASDDEDDGTPRSPRPRSPRLPSGSSRSPRLQRKASGLALAANASQASLAGLVRPRARSRSHAHGDSVGEESSMLADHDAEEADDDGSSASSDATLARPDPVVFADDDSAFGAWEDAPPGDGKRRD